MGKILASLIAVLVVLGISVEGAEAANITLLSEYGDSVVYCKIPVVTCFSDSDGNGYTIADMDDGDWQISYLKRAANSSYDTWHYAMITIANGKVVSLDDYYEWHNPSTWHIVDDTTVSAAMDTFVRVTREAIEDLQAKVDVLNGLVQRVSAIESALARPGASGISSGGKGW